MHLAKTQISLRIRTSDQSPSELSLGSQGPKASYSGQRNLWSACADVKTDMSIQWAHIWIEDLIF